MSWFELLQNVALVAWFSAAVFHFRAARRLQRESKRAHDAAERWAAAREAELLDHRSGR